MATTPYPFVAATVLTASKLNSTFNIPTTTKTASHTLVAADAGTRILINSASATILTLNTSIFAASDVVEIQNIGAGVCTITAGSCSVSTTGTLALVQNAGGRLVFTAASTSIFQADGVAASSSSGLVCVKAETAFSAATSATADSVFTSTYTNYLINFKFQGSTTNDALLKLRVGGVSASTNYNYQDLIGNGSTASATRSTSQTSYILGTNTNGAFNSYVQVNLSSPQLAEPTLIKNDMNISNSAYTGPITRHFYGNHSTATAYDGVEFLCATGTITGSYTIYGYSKTV